MLCRNCGCNPSDHEGGQLCPRGGTLYTSASYWAGIREGRLAEYREFKTGATRDLDADKLDYEGFLSPIVLKRFAEYMHKNRKMSDGSLRASDNWTKGIPKEAYMKSAFRHFMEWWAGHRTGEVDEEAICALIFNANGYLFELLRSKQ